MKLVISIIASTIIVIGLAFFFLRESNSEDLSGDQISGRIPGLVASEELILELTKELKEKSEPQIIYKERDKYVLPPDIDLTEAPIFSPESGKVVDEEYWANLLKQKASLEIDIEKLKMIN